MRLPSWAARPPAQELIGVGTPTRVDPPALGDSIRDHGSSLRAVLHETLLQARYRTGTSKPPAVQVGSRSAGCPRVGALVHPGPRRACLEPGPR
ncbi:MAG TPA: hypothetical protein VHP64_01430, partial [Candidatus Limnocylindria bacterium]|nr:hypothetical protein [Candidatus Limnocylindria bacterium]